MLYSALNELLYGDSLLHIERFEAGRVHSGCQGVGSAESYWLYSQCQLKKVIHEKNIELFKYLSNVFTRRTTF